MTRVFNWALIALFFIAFTACNENKPADENKEGEKTENNEASAPETKPAAAGDASAIVSSVAAWKIDPADIEKAIAENPEMAEAAEAMGTIRLSFKADGTGTNNMMGGEEMQVTWSIENNKLVMVPTESPDGSETKTTMDIVSAQAGKVVVSTGAGDNINLVPAS